MKACIVLALLLFAANPPQKPDGKGQQSNLSANREAPAPVVIVNNAGTDKETDKAKTEAPNGDTSIWANAANWALVAIGFITFIAVWKQARETAKATQAMRDSIPLQKTAADAALLNAQAVINAERPWVMIEKIDEPYLEPWEWPPQTKPDELPPPRPQSELRLSHCMFYLKNFGNTPAKLTAWRYELLIGDSWTTPPETDLWQHEGRDISPYAIAANGILAQPAELVGGVVAIKQRDELLVSRIKTLWLCGIIHYLDAFGKAHKTTFCWVYQTHMNGPRPFWQLGGQWEYNQTT